MRWLRTVRPVMAALVAATLLCVLMLAIWWPGVAMYDSVDQYGQALRGAYDDWHPPIMARLWSLFLLVWPGQAPMFVLQALLCWLGLGLIAAALARDRAPRAAAAVLVLGALPLFAGWQAAEARHCYTPFFWDPYGDEEHCQFVQEALAEQAPGAALFRGWAEAAARHPLAYAAHRLAHWNATLRWLLPSGRPMAAPPDESEPNDAGLGPPGPAGAAAAEAGGWLAETPLGWPILWFAAALAALVLAR